MLAGKFDYVITLKSPNYRYINLTSQLLLFIFLVTYFFYLFQIGMFGKNLWMVVIPLLIIGLWLYGWIRSSDKTFQVHYRIQPAKTSPGLYRKIRGNDAAALGLIAAAWKADHKLFYASYPITPASDILHQLATYKNFGVKTFQAEDEIAAIGAAIGASYGGALGMTASSGPGIALKSEALGLAEPHRYVRVFIDESAWIQPVLTRLVGSWPSRYPVDLLALLAAEPLTLRMVAGSNGLTPREREVLGLMAEGRSNHAIAEALAAEGANVAMFARRRDLLERGVERVTSRVEEVRDGRPVVDGAPRDVATVVWATGFRQTFDWIHLPILGEDGWPREMRGVVDDAPGLFFCGLCFQYAFSSMVLPGVGRERLMADMEKLFFDVMKAIAAIIDAKDGYTHRHSERVAAFSVRLARQLGLDDLRHTIELSALLHDVGKIGVPDAILNKPDKLTDTEFAEMRRHPMHGAAILSNIQSPKVVEILPGVKYHHEKWDGTGYPEGLQGEQIPLPGRILAVADFLDALTSDRSYRTAMSIDEAVALIQEQAGSAFDPSIVEAAVLLHENGELALPLEPGLALLK